MKPTLSKAQRKALCFAHDLMRGSIDARYLPYVRGTTTLIADGRTWRYHRHWIEADQDPTRPYLNEDICTALVMMGYMETRPLTPDAIWMYRITRDGCDAIGRVYPFYTVQVMETIRSRLMAQREQHRQSHAAMLRRRGDGRGNGNLGRRGSDRSGHYFNYRSRRR
ncbi:MAG: hypothetical protein SF162_10485 [bacterium]|nr:hypothetical protein [bacterium]